MFRSFKHKNAKSLFTKSIHQNHELIETRVSKLSLFTQRSHSSFIGSHSSFKFGKYLRKNLKFYNPVTVHTTKMPEFILEILISQEFSPPCGRAYYLYGNILWAWFYYVTKNFYNSDFIAQCSNRISWCLWENCSAVLSLRLPFEAIK